MEVSHNNMRSLANELKLATDKAGILKEVLYLVKQNGGLVKGGHQKAQKLVWQVVQSGASCGVLDHGLDLVLLQRKYSI